VKRIFACGLATDFCVAHSALDARNEGFETFVIEDACRAIDANNSLSQAWARMNAAEVWRIQSGEILGLAQTPPGAGCNRRASCLQANASKNKQSCLDLLGFIWPNRDFSKGYERKNKKFCLAFDSPSRLWRDAPRALSPCREFSSHRRRSPNPSFHERKYTKGSRISQGFVACNRKVAGERFNFTNGLERKRIRARPYRNGRVVGLEYAVIGRNQRRHCERSEAIQKSWAPFVLWIASSLRSSQ
jgi:hypothetical protein